MEVNLKNLKPDIRRLSDMKEVLYDKEWTESASDFDVYYMYRAIKEENDLRYNITVIPAKLLGKEFAKTKGHMHIGNYGEVYTVLGGEAIFLMQRTKEELVEDVYVVKAKEGESAIIPSHYGHVTINPSNIDLKTSDWSSVNCKSDYSLFEKLKGACYFYILRPDSGQAGWIKNKNYKNIPKLRFEKPLKAVPKDLSFLK